LFSINYRDSRPLYEQIVDELRKMIVSGVFAPDEKLPSVRELAQQLAINPNTIQRAYRELELSGYLYSVAGKGNFVGGRKEASETRKVELLQQFATLAGELKYLGVTEEELIRCLSEGGKSND